MSAFTKYPRTYCVKCEKRMLQRKTSDLCRPCERQAVEREAWLDEQRSLKGYTDEERARI